MSESTADLLVLHALRLKGFAAPVGIAAVIGLGVDSVSPVLDRLSQAGMVRHREPHGWSLTADGRSVGERLLADQLDGAEVRGDIVACYQQFRALNPELLQLCSDWQVVDLVQQRLNQHDDPIYDRRLLERLGRLDDDVQQVCRRLADRLPRFGRYGPGFEHALEKLQGGNVDWLTGASIESYHTLWFELHEDLLATLGLTRVHERETESQHA